MMESSQTVLNPAILEIYNTGETIPDAEEPNNGLSKENETNEQQESGIINQVKEEGDSVKTLLHYEEEEPSLIPSTKTSVASSMKENLISSRKQSQRSSHPLQRCQQSVGRQSLPTSMPLQLQPSNDVGARGSVVWLSQRTGKEMKCKFNQTSFVWERKPLAEILHRSSETSQISKDTEKAETEARETETLDQETLDQETEQNAMQQSAHSMQPLEGTGGQGGSPSPEKLEEEASQHSSSEHTIVSQPPQDQKLSQEQPPNDAMMEGDIKSVSKKTGKEVKFGFNQTSFIWERKPLAQILGLPSAKILSPERFTVSPEVEEIKQASVEEVFPSSPQVEEQQLQHGSQQLEAIEAKQDDGQDTSTEAQEAPEEAPEALEKAPEAPEETLEVPEVASKESLLAPEEAPDTPEEALEVPEVTSKEAISAPEETPEAPEEALDVPEVASKEALSAPEETPEAPEEALEVPEGASKEALSAPEEAPETPEEAPKEAPEAPEETPES